eukprot:2668050-Rhodomonas_salina.1
MSTVSPAGGAGIPDSCRPPASGVVEPFGVTCSSAVPSGVKAAMILCVMFSHHESPGMAG